MAKSIPQKKDKANKKPKKAKVKDTDKDGK